MSDELKRLLSESIEEEKKDIDKYRRISDLAESEGLKRIAGVIEDIRHDEITHKNLLESIL